jgi:Ser/Thr protein kinase RdoA (MazF antagonist)
MSINEHHGAIEAYQGGREESKAELLQKQRNEAYTLPTKKKKKHQRIYNKGRTILSGS